MKIDDRMADLMGLTPEARAYVHDTAVPGLSGDLDTGEARLAQQPLKEALESGGVPTGRACSG